MKGKASLQHNFQALNISSINNVEWLKKDWQLFCKWQQFMMENLLESQDMKWLSKTRAIPTICLQYLRIFVCGAAAQLPFNRAAISQTAESPNLRRGSHSEEANYALFCPWQPPSAQPDFSTNVDQNVSRQHAEDFRIGDWVWAKDQDVVRFQMMWIDMKAASNM